MNHTGECTMEHKPFKIVAHPRSFMEGWRVLFLKARHKDGFQHERMIARVTSNALEFQEALVELAAMAQDGERIYAPAANREFSAAQRAFKQNMLDLDYQPVVQQEGWYRDIETRWISALMQPKSARRDAKKWLTDCDDFEFYKAARIELMDLSIPYYHYQTRNGWHLIMDPHDRSKMSGDFNKHTDTNPMMLWGF